MSRKPPAPASPAPEKHTNRIVRHEPGTDRKSGHPADADQADVDTAIARNAGASAPQPFRHRKGLPDITSESVQVRMLKDYAPNEEDRGRFHSDIRARKGELVSFPSDEALRLIEAGIAKRVDDDAPH